MSYDMVREECSEMFQGVIRYDECCIELNIVFELFVYLGFWLLRRSINSC